MQGVFGDRYAQGRGPSSALKKTVCPCGRQYRSFYDRKRKRVRDLSCGGFRVFLDIEIRRIECVQCGTVRQESLSFLADNRSYTKRFAFYVGRRCRASTIKDIAEELHLDWQTVKDAREAVHAGAAAAGGDAGRRR